MALLLRQLQLALRHEEVLHGDAPLAVAEEARRGTLGQFVAFGRLLPVTIRFAQRVLHKPPPIHSPAGVVWTRNWATRCRS
jgi:hypothetical protein